MKSADAVTLGRCPVNTFIDTFANHLSFIHVENTRPEAMDEAIQTREGSGVL